MSFPDANWVTALKLPTRVMIGLFIACGLVLALDSLEVIPLSELGSATKPIAIVVAVFSGSLAATGVGGIFWDQWIAKNKQSALATRRKLRLAEENEKRQKAEQTALERVDHLSPKELRHLANCLRSGSQSFYTWVHDPALATLMGKRLVYTSG